MNWIVRILIVIVALAGIQPVTPAAAMVGPSDAAAVHMTGHQDHEKMMALMDKSEHHKQVPCTTKAVFCCWQAHGVVAGELTPETRLNMSATAFLPAADTRLAGLPATPPQEPPRTSVD